MSTQNKNLLVKDVMLSLDEFPVISERVILKEALEAMGMTRLGIVCITDQSGILVGILTDGDIRRKLLSVQKPFSAFFVDDAIDHGIRNPKTTTPDSTLISAVEKMGESQVWDLPVVDENGRLSGLLHLHPAIKALLDMS
jgi:DeoR family transcriptional regulator, catabolite repression regulator